MSKNIKLKTSREFLKNYFPENIRPWAKLSKKEKRILRMKFFFFLRIKNRQKKLEKTFIQNRKGIKTSKQFLKQVNVLKKKIYPRFLYSIEQLNNQFLHNQNQTKRSSEYLLKIKEKKKFSLLYGKIGKKFFQKVFTQAQRERGSVSNNLIIFFETRLDVILYRIFFAKSISSARQMINHNCILVNGVITNISSYQIKPGDIIAVDQKKNIYISNLIINNLKKKAKITKNGYSNRVRVKYKNYNQERVLFKLKNIAFSLTKKKKQKFLNLQRKRLMARKFPRSRYLTCMRVSPMKPLHLEVSYKQLKAVFLYYPQKMVYPATINLDLLSRSII